MKIRILTKFFVAAATTVFLAGWTGIVAAQGGAGTGGPGAGGTGATGGFDTGGATNTGLTTGSTGTSASQQSNSSGGTQTGTVDTAAQSGSVDPSNAVNLTTSDDTRNQGFVGVTAPGIQTLGYVGASSANSGPPLATGATFGGGVNSTGGGGGAAGGRAAGGQAAGGFQGQGFGGAAAQNGFSITRQNMRARLVPIFSAPVFSDNEMSSRFKAGFSRLPESQNFSGQYQVAISERTATITGSVRSQADSDRLVRQLRLQPGVYEIDNQLQVGQ